MSFTSSQPSRALRKASLIQTSCQSNPKLSQTVVIPANMLMSWLQLFLPLAPRCSCHIDVRNSYNVALGLLRCVVYARTFVHVCDSDVTVAVRILVCISINQRLQC